MAAFRLPRRVALGGVVSVAIVLRLAALAGPPTTSDDLYRYSWDGRAQAAGIDPYADPPSDPALASLRDRWLWPTDPGCAALHRGPGCTRINRPSARTIYPPVAEAWFAGVYRIGGIGARHKAWQVAGMVVDLLTVLVLLVALRRWGRDLRWAAVYALCPAPVLEFVNNGHVDGVAVALLIGALAISVAPRGAHAHGRLSSTQRDIAVGLLIGAAALVKIYPAVLLLAVLGLPRARPGRSLGRASLAAGALTVLAYLPHVLAVGWRILGYLPGYLKEEHYDKGGRFLLPSILGFSGKTATAAATLAFMGVIVWVVRYRPDAPTAALTILGGLFLATTPVQPWYAVSLVAVASLAASPWATAVAIAAYPYFFAVILNARNPAAWGRLTYGLALLVVVVGCGHANRKRRRSASGPTAPSPARRSRGDRLPKLVGGRGGKSRHEGNGCFPPQRLLDGQMSRWRIAAHAVEEPVVGHEREKQAPQTSERCVRSGRKQHADEREDT